MIITKANENTINTKEVYIHDDILIGMSFDRIKKELILKFEKYTSREKTYHIKFFSVIGFRMTSADFWGESERVLGLELANEDEKIVIPEIIKKYKETPNAIEDILYENYIETYFTFASGDVLRIACESIEID